MPRLTLKHEMKWYGLRLVNEWLLRCGRPFSVNQAVIRLLPLCSVQIMDDIGGLLN